MRPFSLFVFLFFFLFISLPLFADDPVYSSKSSDHGIVLRDQLSPAAYHDLLRDSSDQSAGAASAEGRVRYQNVAASKNVSQGKALSIKYRQPPPKRGFTFGQVANDIRNEGSSSGPSFSFKDLSKRFRLSTANAGSK